MRYRVMLIDDEPWILDGMKLLLPWADHGLAIERTFIDPLEALERIIEDPPDVVFADIRMPELSGIELLRACRTHGLSCEFILVSGYAEFEYAKEALRLGAFDYLTKPIELEVVPEMFSRLRERLDTKYIRENLRILDELSTPQGAAHMLGEAKHGGFVILCADGDRDAAIECFGHAAKCTLLRALAASNHQTVLIFGADESGQQTLLSMMPNGKPIRIGISKHARRAAEIPELLREAYLARYQCYVDPAQTLCAFDPGGMDKLRGFAMSLKRAAEQGTLPDALLDLPGQFKREHMQLLHAEQIWNYVAAMPHIESTGAIPSYTAEELIAHFDSFQTQCAVLSELTRPEGVGESPGGKRLVNEQFLLLLKEVEETFTGPLSLGELSSRYFLNLSYVSELFRRVTGVTFTEYVTKLRMERARELLKLGRELQQIAAEAGYDDYFYFSKVFKKYYGVPPTQYRI